MARPYRLQGENIFYHITNRGNGRQKIFLNNVDFKKFLEYLLKAKEKYSFYLYAYILMSNHYHLLIETRYPNLSKIMQYINSSYTTYFNIKRKKVGHMFQGRYKSIVVDKDNYFLGLTRYIHLNPIRAKMVNRPEEYQWSSYNGFIKRKGDGYIDKSCVRKQITMTIKNYRQFVFEGINKKESPFKDIYGGFILGKPPFIKEKLKDLKDQVEGKEYSYNKTFKNHIKTDDIIAAIEDRYSKSFKEICTSKSRPQRTKQISIYLLKTVMVIYG